MHEKDIISTFREGFMSRATIEGMLNIVQAKKQKKVSKGLDAQFCHFITTSDMHQKLGTFS